MKPQNQTILTMIIALVMTTGFIGVYAVGYEYNSNTDDIADVFVTDSNMEFSEMDSTYIPAMINIQPYGIGSYMRDSSGVYHKNNCTPVYTGNNTWETSFIGFSATSPLYQSAFYLIPIDIPDAKTFVAEKIHINITLPNELVNIGLYIGGYDIPQTANPIPSVTLSNQVPYSTGEYVATYTLTDYQKLAWYNAANNYDMPSLSLYIYDPYDVRDGLSSFAFIMNANITGKSITTWSLQDSVNVVLGISVTINFIVGAYMTDGFDFQTKRKTLTGKSGIRKPRKKNTNRRK